MTFAYWMLLVAALLPYFTGGLAKSGGVDNHAPRPSLENPRRVATTRRLVAPQPFRGVSRFRRRSDRGRIGARSAEQDRSSRRHFRAFAADLHGAVSRGSGRVEIDSLGSGPSRRRLAVLARRLRAQDVPA